MSNFTLQDLAGTSFAVALFSLIYLSPGYLTAWLLDLFDFRKRLPATRFVIGIVISIAISPIISFLAWHLISLAATFVVFGIFGIGSIILMVRTKWTPATSDVKRYQVIAVCIGAAWIIFSTLFLVDIQIGNRLYYNIISFDFTSRVAVINAMTRTGVPPINPSYFPGHSVSLTYLYYFWYIPCSLIAQIGSPWITGRTALIASVAWCGLAVMATIALYLRLRNPEGGAKAWKSGLIGSGLLLISGLDFIPALLLIIQTRITYGSSVLAGDIEHWNEQITAWIGSISWVPHHVAAMMACLVGLMLVQSVRNLGTKKQIQAMSVAGLAFASAFGLSVYVTLVFIIFWGCWMLVLFFQKERQLSATMALAGIVAMIAASPFIMGLISGGSGSANSFPIAFAVRDFQIIESLMTGLNSLSVNLLLLILLPISYILELGFFFIAGLLWIEQHKKSDWLNNPFHLAEVILISIIIFAGSFLRSTAIGNNDFGWRVWLLGQFVLLIWSVDIIFQYFPNGIRISKIPIQFQKTGRSLILLLLLGFTTTFVDIALLRSWTILVDKGIPGFPNAYSPDEKLGERSLAARTAYEYIDANLPEAIHVQRNPTDALNIPIGLYLNRPMIIAGQTAYGVATDNFDKSVSRVAEIFQTENSWSQIDDSCKQNYIDVIVITDLDPLWKQLKNLEQERKPLFIDDYYAVFKCGNFENSSPKP